MRKFRFSAAISAAALLLASCGGGGDSNDFGGTPSPSPAPSPTPAPIDGTGGAYTPPAQESLSVTDVQKIIAQAVGEAKARNLPSVIAVTDRVGNVLAVFERSEEHTSELQSRENLVCRLLLEKKKGR